MIKTDVIYVIISLLDYTVKYDPYSDSILISDPTEDTIKVIHGFIYYKYYLFLDYIVKYAIPISDPTEGIIKIIHGFIYYKYFLFIINIIYCIILHYINIFMVIAFENKIIKYHMHKLSFISYKKV